MPRDDGRDYPFDDYGQADYSRDYGYDPRHRTGYRDDPTSRAAYPNHLRGRPDERWRPPEHRSWLERAGEIFGEGAALDGGYMGPSGAYVAAEGLYGQPARSPRRRRGPSDRVLWAVIAERLEDERRLDLRDVELIVEDGEVTLNGTVRHKADKRRIEDVADIDGVRHVQNNLRIRDRGWFR